MAKMANMKIDLELLAELLHFPEGTEILNASISWTRDPRVLNLMISHPDFPEKETKGFMPIVNPSYRTIHHAECEHNEVEFVKWGGDVESPHRRHQS